nr:hypothetical transcript [Hymenolepis microstoma]
MSLVARNQCQLDFLSFWPHSKLNGSNLAKELAISESVEVTQEFECALAIILDSRFSSPGLYPEFSGFESSYLVKFLQHSTEGSAEVVVSPDKDDFSYWSFSSVIIWH